MNTPLHEMVTILTRELPGVVANIDEPANPDGLWFLDLTLGGEHVGVSWSPKKGYGISASAFDVGIGDRPQEIYPSLNDTVTRVLDLLKNRKRTKPPRAVLLRELRSLFDITQEELADRLGVRQATVSRMERRKDLTLSTLRRMIEAMGGELELVARFPNEDVVISSSGEEKRSPERSRLCCSHVSEPPTAKRDDIAVWTPTTSMPPASEFERKVARHLSDWLEKLSGLSGCEVNPSVEVVSDDSPDLVWNDGDSLIVFNVKASQEWLGGVRDGNSRFSCLTSILRERREAADRVSVQMELYTRFLSHEIGHLLLDRRADSRHCTPKERELDADSLVGWFDGLLGRSHLIGAALFRALGCSEIGCDHPTPQARESAYLEGFGRGDKSRSLHPVLGTTSRSPERDARPSFNATILRVTDLEESRRFYAALGLDLTEERHGNGPRHYASELPNGLLELYPKNGSPRCSNRLVLSVRSLDSIAEDAGSRRITKRGTLILSDPDGNEVELVESRTLESRTRTLGPGVSAITAMARNDSRPPDIARPSSE